MNWLDIVLLILFALFVFEGLRHGFSRVAIGLIATVLGLFLASWFYGVAGAFLMPYVSSKSIANIGGFLMVFFGVQIAGALLGWLLSRMFKWTGLSWLDRILGAALGALKAALVGIILVMILLAFPIRQVPASVAQSQLAPHLVEAAYVLVYMTPREFKDGFLATYDRIKKIWSGHEVAPLQKDSV